VGGRGDHGQDARQSREQGESARGTQSLNVGAFRAPVKPDGAPDDGRVKRCFTGCGRWVPLRTPFFDQREAALRRILLAVLAVLGLCLAIATSADAAPVWAPAGSATIHPGVQTVTDGGQCTANFIYYDASNVYIGQAAHCSGTGGATETDGCDSGSLPEGTAVDVDGASRPGTMVYNSWIRMQAANESNADTCAYNDLALVRLDPADASKVNPSIPFWGGPTGTTGTVADGATVESYGNSSLRGGVTQLSPKQGVSLAQDSGGWNHWVYTATPGIPGDSGSAFIDDQGRAFGVLSTVQIAPAAGSNGVGDVSRELSYAAAHGVSVTLANGTEPFRGPLP
jgi:hypothetical protein